jgi:glutamyl-tRNA synthetase
LFNQLYARHTGGRFLLRIEDTDRARSTEEAVAAIFEGLAWLGIETDGEPVFQHTRADRHREAVEELLASGNAYRDYMTAEELDAEREAARAEGRAVRSPWRDRAPPTGANLPHVVRFKGPKDGDTVIDDLVQGPVRFSNDDLDDLVLLRSDGAPTYNLAVVVDDHDMGVTHVIRGDDHLNNAPRQALIYQALGWERPAFAHIPLIHGPDGAKLSKRHGAQAVGDFANQGYLPEAMRNYLTRLGWGHGDDEIFSDEQAAAWFDIKDVGRAPARLDWDKLASVNAHYIRQADDARLGMLVARAFASRDPSMIYGEFMGILDRVGKRLVAAMPFLKTRGKTILELVDQAEFLLAERPLALDDKVGAILTEETVSRLRRLAAALATTASWSDPDLELLLKAFAASEGVGLGKIGPGLRGVLTGGRPSPDLSKTLAALGRDETLARIHDALSQRT